MKTWNQTILFLGLYTLCNLSASAEDITIKLSKKYLNFPISHQTDRKQMTFSVDGHPDLTVNIRLAPGKADYWVFKDVSNLKGETLTITYNGDAAGLKQIYQSDKFAGQDSLYHEKNRPQFHFTTRRGWINDPNGLIYYNGEYHLFYQHNPYEREWENMHWGHAVSKDLIHWEELNDVLCPDKLGTIFSGSAIIDYENTSGFGSKKNPPMVAAFTYARADGQTQGIAYSLDNGRTFTKYVLNPVINSTKKWKTNDTRDPKVFWYKPNGEWVMVLNERDGHSIYTSTNLKEWTYRSHVTGFWECPELFELPVDDDPNHTKWVMYGASGTYMLGAFDGHTFTPEAGKYYYTTGSIYAAQTYNNIPASDGRRIQIGWGRIAHPGMPFNGMYLLPTELKLKTTKDGIRLTSQPIKETEQLFHLAKRWNNLTSDEANQKMKEFYDADCLRIKTTIKLSHATDAGFNLFGQRMIGYDMNGNTINGVFYSPQDPTSMEISADIYIDRTSIEVFIDGGLYSYSMERRPDPNNQEGFWFWGNRIEIKNIEVYTVDSIWK